MFKKLLFLILLFSFASKAQTLSKEAKVSILTCGTGEELHSKFGHTAIRVKDTSLGIDVVYNYGMFDFSTPNFYLKFVKGNLQYFVSTNSFSDFIETYKYYNRDVWEQVLNFDTNQKQELFDNLNVSLDSDKRFYTYKFIDKNCTSMVVDKINKIYQTKLIVKKSKLEEDYRTVVNSYLDDSFYEKLGINIMFGYRTDQKAEKLFLPLELLESINKTTFGKQKISSETLVLNKKSESKNEKAWWNTIYTFIAFLIFITITNNTKVFSFYFIVLGVIGVLLLSIGNYSEHKEVLDNYNVFLFNPTLLLLVFFYWRKNVKIFRFFCYMNLFFLLILLVFLINKSHLMIFIPLLLTSGFIIWKMMQKQQLSIKK